MAVNIESISADEAIPLLVACDLPVADISPSAPLLFFGVRTDQGELAAAVGLESYPPSGLLRSLATSPLQRCRGTASALIAHAESVAASHGIETLFLLTTTAAGFFANLGYSVIPRDGAPREIQATSQFSVLCPSSAKLMAKQLSADSAIA